MLSVPKSVASDISWVSTSPHLKLGPASNHTEPAIWQADAEHSVETVSSIDAVPSNRDAASKLRNQRSIPVQVDLTLFTDDDSGSLPHTIIDADELLVASNNAHVSEQTSFLEAAAALPATISETAVVTQPATPDGAPGVAESRTPSIQLPDDVKPHSRAKGASYTDTSLPAPDLIGSTGSTDVCEAHSTEVLLPSRASLANCQPVCVNRGIDMKAVRQPALPAAHLADQIDLHELATTASLAGSIDLDPLLDTLLTYLHL